MVQLDDSDKGRNFLVHSSALNERSKIYQCSSPANLQGLPFSASYRHDTIHVRHGSSHHWEHVTLAHTAETHTASTWPCKARQTM